MKEPILESVRFRVAIVTIIVVAVMQLIPAQLQCAPDVTGFCVTEEQVSHLANQLVIIVLGWIGARTLRPGSGK